MIFIPQRYLKIRKSLHSLLQNFIRKYSAITLKFWIILKNRCAFMIEEQFAAIRVVEFKCASNVNQQDILPMHKVFECSFALITFSLKLSIVIFIFHCQGNIHYRFSNKAWYFSNKIWYFPTFYILDHTITHYYNLA